MTRKKSNSHTSVISSLPAQGLTTPSVRFLNIVLLLVDEMRKNERGLYLRGLFHTDWEVTEKLSHGIYIIFNVNASKTGRHRDRKLFVGLGLRAIRITTGIQSDRGMS